ncbi:MAG: membrane protein insertase YidC [Jatrophihabitantaceae bacterium]
MLDFLYTAVSWVLLQWHHLFNFLGMDPNGGLNWALSIIFLVVTARLLLFRLFVKQVKYQRHMQQMQPKIQALRKKHKDDKAEMQRQMMKLQQDEGFNPLSGCLPMFLQFPIFIGLYHVLRHMSNSITLCNSGNHTSSVLQLYTFKAGETCSAAQAKLFGAPLAARLTDTAHQIGQLHGAVGITRVVIVILVLVSAGATYMTQRLVRVGALTPPEGTAATIQKLMMYLIPVGTLGSGLFFPLGVLLYWFTSNTWTMGQQLYINKFHPHTADTAPSTATTVGAALAPKPGQRPVRPAKGKTSLIKGVDVLDGPAPPPARTEEASADTVIPPGQRSAPRPGQRPQRPAGKRPPAKRPTQAKKRR